MWWRRFNMILTVAMVLLWTGAIVTGWIGSTTFIGHVSMLALVLAAWSAYRSDDPNEGG